jgi:hypothetical protein
MYTQALDLPDPQGRTALKAVAAQPDAARSRPANPLLTPRSTPTARSNRKTGCLRPTARRWCVRSASMPTAKSSACCPRATGSAAPPASNARPSCWPRCKTRRPRPVPVQRRRNPGHQSRPGPGCPAHRQSQVQQHLQLPHPHLGRHGRDWLAGGRRGHHEPDAPFAAAATAPTPAP